MMVLLFVSGGDEGNEGSKRQNAVMDWGNLRCRWLEEDTSN